MLCVDEESQIQASDRTQPILPMQPGLIERRSHDYVRHGTSTLFAALEIATEPGSYFCGLVGGVVVHHQVELLAAVAGLERGYR